MRILGALIRETTKTKYTFSQECLLNFLYVYVCVFSEGTKSLNLLSTSAPSNLHFYRIIKKRHRQCVRFYYDCIRNSLNLSKPKKLQTSLLSSAHNSNPAFYSSTKRNTSKVWYSFGVIVIACKHMSAALNRFQQTLHHRTDLSNTH